MAHSDELYMYVSDGENPNVAGPGENSPRLSMGLPTVVYGKARSPVSNVIPYGGWRSVALR